MPGARVVNDAVVGVVPSAGTGRGVEACVAGREVSRPAQRCEGACIEAQVVPAITAEVAERVGMAGAVFPKPVPVLARAAGERVVAPASLDPVVARITVDRVVAAAADQRVVARRADEALARRGCGGRGRSWR